MSESHMVNLNIISPRVNLLIIRKIKPLHQGPLSKYGRKKRKAPIYLTNVKKIIPFLSIVENNYICESTAES